MGRSRPIFSPMSPTNLRHRRAAVKSRLRSSGMFSAASANTRCRYRYRCRCRCRCHCHCRCRCSCRCSWAIVQRLSPGETPSESVTSLFGFTVRSPSGANTPGELTNCGRQGQSPAFDTSRALILSRSAPIAASCDARCNWICLASSRIAPASSYVAADRASAATA